MAGNGTQQAGALRFEESARQIAQNARYIAGGVNSNFRLGMQPGPLVFERGEGAYLIDADGNRIIDYYCAPWARPCSGTRLRR
ncbi:Glutamate-1-semialdehyde 2,1-aminomutase OS=Bosea thiooxidans OX=53254 GN=SAMN05660750_03138 PE=3 SV=1 [Bosea thiooxidans]